MKTSTYRMLCMVVVVSAVLGTSLQSYAQPQPPVEEPTFGIVGGYWRPMAAGELGVGWDRITFDWSRFQPNGPGDFIADTVRPAWIEQSIASGRQVVGMIVNTPTWASSAQTVSGVPASLYRAADDPENLWALFLQQLVQVYAPLGVHHWIIWDNIDAAPNQPDFRFEGTTAAYVQMVRIAHEVLRAEDETARIYLGGLVRWPENLANTDGVPYLQRFLDELSADEAAAANNFYFDGVTLNFLIQPQGIPDTVIRTDTILPAIQQTQQILELAGLNEKSIWVTELNASPTRDIVDGFPDVPLRISPMQQADFIVQGVALSLAAGVDRIAVYELFDANRGPNEVPYGLIRSDNSVRPAFAAYKLAVDLFSNNLMVAYDETTNGRLVTLTQESRTVFVMWSANTTRVSFWIEARFGDELQLRDATGNVLPNPRQGVGPEGVAVHVIDTLPAMPSFADETVLISGSPRIVVLNTTEPRRVWASLGDTIGVQLR